MTTDLFCKCGGWMGIPDCVPPEGAIRFFAEKHSGEGHGETTFMGCSLAKERIVTGVAGFMDYASAKWALARIQEAKP